jgi:hypothetical protein
MDTLHKGDNDDDDNVYYYYYYSIFITTLQIEHRGNTLTTNINT